MDAAPQAEDGPERPGNTDHACDLSQNWDIAVFWSSDLGSDHGGEDFDRCIAQNGRPRASWQGSVDVMG
jgi:hypothetical protein